MKYDLIKYDNTKLSTWRECSLKGYLRHYKNYVQDAQGISAALEYGRVWHLCMDDLYTHHDLNQTQELFIKLYYPIFEQLEQTDPSGAKRHGLDLGTNSLKKYWEYWQENILAMDLIACEQYFSIDLEMNDEPSTCPDCNGSGDTYTAYICRMCRGQGWIIGPVYCGKVDKIFRDKHSQLIVGMDHKTASQLNGALISAFKISQQFRGYVYWLVRHSDWKDECGEYFYYDLVLKTRTKYNADNVPFYRDSVLAQAPFLDEWLDDVKKHISDIQIMIERTRSVSDQFAHAFLPRQESNSCNNYNRLCSYYDLCSNPRETRATLADQLYEIKEWNPLSEDE